MEYCIVWNKGAQFGQQRRATSKGFAVKDIFKTCKVCTAADSSVTVAWLGKYNRREGMEDSARSWRLFWLNSKAWS